MKRSFEEPEGYPLSIGPLTLEVSMKIFTPTLHASFFNASTAFHFYLELLH
jgi:hypothetical protein